MNWLFGTASFYIMRRFLVWIAIIIAVISILFTCLDALELTKRLYASNVTFAHLVTIMFARLPSHLIEVMPFGALIGVMVCFQHLSRGYELIALQNAGVAPKQFVASVLLVALALGVITITVLNPISTALLNQADRLEHKHTKTSVNSLAVSRAGIWFRDNDTTGNFRRIIHAGRIDPKSTVLGDVLVLHFHPDDSFAERIQAKSAFLVGNKWNLRHVVVTTRDVLHHDYIHYELPTDTVIGRLQDSLVAPESLTFWELPQFIASLKHSGFQALRHTVYWYSLLMFPLFLMGLVLIGACFSIYLPRIERGSRLFLSGLFIGFLIYFGTKLIHALGFSGSIAPFLAASSPTLICILAGTAFLLHREEV
jgi:lipopolysaccharide export system permease protein